MPWCEGFILREGLCGIEIDPENSVWLARYYHHVPRVRITVTDLRIMDLSKDITEAREPALREGQKVHLMHIRKRTELELRLEAMDHPETYPNVGLRSLRSMHSITP